MMPKTTLLSSMVYPDDKTLQRGRIQNDVGAAESVYQHYWELLKIGG